MLRLSSTTEDQLSRVGLFDWLAEAVLYDVMNGLATAPFNGPGFTLTRMLSSGVVLHPSTANTTAVGGKEEKERDAANLVDCVVATLEEIAVSHFLWTCYLTPLNSVRIGAIFGALTSFFSLRVYECRHFF